MKDLLKSKASSFTDEGADAFNAGGRLLERAWEGLWTFAGLAFLILATVCDWLHDIPAKHRARVAEERRRLAESAAARAQVQELDGRQ